MYKNERRAVQTGCPLVRQPVDLARTTLVMRCKVQVILHTLRGISPDKGLILVGKASLWLAKRVHIGIAQLRGLERERTRALWRAVPASHGTDRSARTIIAHVEHGNVGANHGRAAKADGHPAITVGCGQFKVDVGAVYGGFHAHDVLWRAEFGRIGCCRSREGDEGEDEGEEQGVEWNDPRWRSRELHGVPASDKRRRSRCVVLVEGGSEGEKGCIS